MKKSKSKTTEATSKAKIKIQNHEAITEAFFRVRLPKIEIIQNQEENTSFLAGYFWHW